MADNYLSDPTLYNANKTIKPRHNFDQEGGNDLPPAEGELGYPGDQEQVVHENQTTNSQNALKAQIFNEYERTFRYLTNILGNVHDPVILDGVEEVTDIGDALRRLFNRVSSAGMQAFTPRLIAMTSGMGIVRSQKTDPSGFTYFGDYPPSYQEANFFPEQGKQFDILGGPEPDDPSNPSKYYLYIEQGFGVTDSGVTNPNPNDFYGTEDIPVVKIEINAATLGDNADWDHVLDDYMVPPPVIDGTTGANEVIWTDHGIYLEGKIALTEDCSTWIEEDGVYINGVRYNLLIVEATGGLEIVEDVQKIVNPTEIYDIGGAGIFEICEGPYVEPHGGTEGGWDRPCHNARCGIFITTLGPATTPQIDPSTKKYYAYFKRYRPQWYLIQSGVHKDPNTNADIDGINVVEIEDPDETIRTAENIPLYAVYVDHPSRGISKIVDLRRYINFMGHNDSATYESLEERLKASGNTKAIADRPEFTLDITDNPGVIAPTYTLNIINDSYIYGSKTGDEEGFLYVGNLKELSIHRSTFTITGTGTLILDISPDDPIQVGDKIWQPYKDGYKYHGEVTGASGTDISYNDLNSGITQNIRELIFIREVTSIELDTVEQTHDGANYTFYRKGNFFYFPDGVFGSLTDTPDTNTVLREVDVDTGTEYTGKVCRVVTTYETNVEGIDYDVVQVDDAQHFEIDGRAEFVFNHTGNTDCLVGEILDTDKFVEDIYIDGTYVGRTSNMDSTIKNDEYSYNIGSNGHEWTSRTRRILIWKTTIEEAHESWNANKFVIAIPLINERAIWYRDRIITAETIEEDGSVITNVPYSYGRIGRHGIILNPDESDYGYAALTGENIRFHHSHAQTIRDYLRYTAGYILVGTGISSDSAWDDTIYIDRGNRYVGVDNGNPLCRVQVDNLDSGGGVWFYSDTQADEQGIHFTSDGSSNMIRGINSASSPNRPFDISTDSISGPIRITPTGKNIVQAVETELIVNPEAYADADLRVLSNVNDYAFFIRSSDGNIGVGLSNPDSAINVETDRGIKIGTGSSHSLSNYWAKEQFSIDGYGSFGTQGSFGLTVAWNWYRKNATEYTVMDIDSNTEAGGMWIDSTGISLMMQDSYGTAETSPPTTRVKILPDGKVGVGTNIVPDFPFHVINSEDMAAIIDGSHASRTRLCVRNLNDVDAQVSFMEGSTGTRWSIGNNGSSHQLRIANSYDLNTSVAFSIEELTNGSRVGAWRNNASGQGIIMDCDDGGNRLAFLSSPGYDKDSYIDFAGIDKNAYIRTYNGSYYNNIIMSHGKTIINGLEVSNAELNNVFIKSTKTLSGNIEDLLHLGLGTVNYYNVVRLLMGTDTSIKYHVVAINAGYEHGHFLTLFNQTERPIVIYNDVTGGGRVFRLFFNGTSGISNADFGAWAGGYGGSLLAEGYVIGRSLFSDYVYIIETSGDWNNSSIDHIIISSPAMSAAGEAFEASIPASNAIWLPGNILQLNEWEAATFCYMYDRWRLINTTGSIT